MKYKNYLLITYDGLAGLSLYDGDTPLSAFKQYIVDGDEDYYNDFSDTDSVEIIVKGLEIKETILINLNDDDDTQYDFTHKLIKQYPTKSDLDRALAREELKVNQPTSINYSGVIL